MPTVLLRPSPDLLTLYVILYIEIAAFLVRVFKQQWTPGRRAEVVHKNNMGIPDKGAILELASIYINPLLSRDVFFSFFSSCNQGKYPVSG